MSFSPEWLALRAPADDRARSARVLEAAAAFLAKRPNAVIVDLGCGSGATWRALSPHAPPGVRWRLVDWDPALLAAAAAAAPGAETLQADLADPAALAAALSGADLIAASAFFDLVSRDWIARFAAAAPASAAIYAALTYDGRAVWRPAQTGEAAVLAALHGDMTRDKGFGPALGPASAAALETALAASGRLCVGDDSPWRLERPRDAALIEALKRGSADAAATAGDAASDWRAWPHQTAWIGHRDVFAAPLAKPAPPL